MKICFCLIILLFFSCSKEENKHKRDLSKQTLEEEKEKVTSFSDSTAIFDTTNFYGSEVLKWHHSKIDSRFVSLKSTREGLFIPKTTKQIDIHPLGNEIFPYSLGLGKILKNDDKSVCQTVL